MAYATIDDLRGLLPDDVLAGLTDDESLGQTDSARAASALAEASAEIDGWLGGRYSVPLAEPAPEIIRKLCVDIAAYNLYSRRVTAMPDVIAERYRQAARLLESIAKGTVTLGGAAAATPSAAPDGAETTASAARIVFSRDKLAGF